VQSYLNRNPARSLAGRCLGCGGRDHAYDPLLPYGTESAGHVWLHSRCWPAWHESGKAKAAAALATRGIATFASFPNASGKTEARNGRLQIRTGS
jgi:hypothetical protein